MKEHIKQLIPLGLVVIALVYTAIIVLTSNVALTYQHWIAYGLISIVLALYFLNRRLSKIVFGLTLFLGLINILAFTPSIMIFGNGHRFTVMDVQVTTGIQIFSLFIFLTFIYAQRQEFIEWLKKD